MLRLLQNMQHWSSNQTEWEFKVGGRYMSCQVHDRQNWNLTDHMTERPPTYPPPTPLFKQQSEFLIFRLHIIANYDFLDFWLLLVIFMQGKRNFRSCCCLKYKPKINESKIVLILISIIFATTADWQVQFEINWDINFVVISNSVHAN